MPVIMKINMLNRRGLNVSHLTFPFSFTRNQSTAVGALRVLSFSFTFSDGIPRIRGRAM